MDGLIPLVYKAITKRRTRQHYECLSSSGNSSRKAFNIEEDLYPNGETYMTPPNSGHRRHRSLVEFSDSRNDSRTTYYCSPTKPKKLGRLRSHRMFSCVTGC
ncbi:hypothetical protein ACFE04_004145 [Oxalis oulophora]